MRIANINAVVANVVVDRQDRNANGVRLVVRAASPSLFSRLVTLGLLGKRGWKHSGRKQASLRSHECPSHPGMPGGRSIYMPSTTLCTITAPTAAVVQWRSERQDLSLFGLPA